MSDTLIGAIITAIATITGGSIFALIQYRARHPQLRATVYVHDISLPIFLQTYLRQLLRDGQTPAVAPDPSDQLGTLAGLRSYVHLTLQNRAIMHLTEREICGMVRSIGVDHVRLDQSGIH